MSTAELVPWFRTREQLARIPCTSEFWFLAARPDFVVMALRTMRGRT